MPETIVSRYTKRVRAMIKNRCNQIPNEYSHSDLIKQEKQGKKKKIKKKINK